MALVLDSGGLTRLSDGSQDAAALIRALRRRGLWPPVVPTVVLAESLTGAASRDTNTNRLLKACDVKSTLPENLARRAGHLRTLAKHGSAVDALVVAYAEPGSTILTGDKADLEALAAHADRVAIELI